MPPTRIKRLKRVFRKNAMSARSRIAETAPEPLRRWTAPAIGYADMLLFDHLFVRILFPNRHRLSKQAWRAAQPLPYQLKKIKSLGIRTVINLRGNNNTPTYRHERDACARLGLTYIDYCLRSRAAPSKDEVLGLRRLFETAEHPILLHCKSGADRAGLASVLYLHVVENVPIDQAKHQLSLRFGHIRHADTGILDAFFEQYLTANAAEPIDFFTWVETRYDPKRLKVSFTAKKWANRLVDSFLGRE